MKMLSGIVLLTAALTMTPFAAYAAPSAKQLIDTNGCSACHADKVKIIGPAWGWISYHFKGQKNAVETIADFIINGGVGYWRPWTGNVPMPSHPKLTKGQARTIAEWILSQPQIKPPTP